jgi:hypothetical protein
VPTIGVAFDSLILLLEIGFIVTVIVLGLAIWRGVLSGNLKTSLIRRKPLLVPSLVFTFTIIIVALYVPLPMSIYHGPNQVQPSIASTRTFTIYEAGAYEADTLVRINRGLETNDRLEFYAYFTQNDSVILTLFINMTNDILDTDGGVTRSISLDPGRYDVTFNSTFYFNGIEQEEGAHVGILINQPISSVFIPENIAWSTYRFVLGITCFFFVLAGICIGREDKTRRSKEKIDQEPPREGEVYGRRLGW